MRYISLKRIPYYLAGVLIFINTTRLVVDTHRKDILSTSAFGDGTNLLDLNLNSIQPEDTNTEVEVDDRSDSDAAKPYRKWAYMFLVAGCDRKKNDHTGFIANVAVSAKILLDHKSTADVVVLIQMSHDSEYETLSGDENKILAAVPNIKVKYIPKFSAGIHQNFYSVMMEKFRVLDLTQYSRVLFLDGDVMPYTSLDYLFNTSEPDQKLGKPQVSATMMENMILEMGNEPASGGFFMLKPSHKDYLRAIDVITETEKKALNLEWPHWNPVIGFGQIMLDEWGSIRGSELPRTNWTWHGSFADQGFLYHWVKYEKKSFSSIASWDNTIMNYSPVDGKAQNVVVHKNDDKGGGIFGKSCRPMCDFRHFTGSKKPWKKGRDESGWRPMKFRADFKLWYSVLNDLEKRTNVTLEFKQKTAVGAYPTYHERIKHIKHKAVNNWTMYE